MEKTIESKNYIAFKEIREKIDQSIQGIKSNRDFQKRLVSVLQEIDGNNRIRLINSIKGDFNKTKDEILENFMAENEIIETLRHDAEMGIVAYLNEIEKCNLMRIMGGEIKKW